MLIQTGQREPGYAVPTAMLNCEADPSCGRWVRHNFVGRRDCADGSRLPMYVCSRCGHKRAFGREAVPVSLGPRAATK